MSLNKIQGNKSQSQWLLSLRCRSATARLLSLCLRIPPGAWTFVCCGCCVSSGRGLCDGLITRPEESYLVWCVWSRAVKGVGLQPLACWDCGFESHRVGTYVCRECCVLSGRGLCDGLITRPEESYRVWCVWSRDLNNEEAVAHRGAVTPKTNSR